MLKASVFVPLAETQRKFSSILPQVGHARSRAVSYSPVSRRRLPIHAGFRACRPRISVPVIGIIHGGFGSLMRTGGDQPAAGLDRARLAPDFDVLEQIALGKLGEV